MADKFTSMAIVVDRYGKEHKVFPAKLAWKEEIQRLTPKFNDSSIILNIMIPKFNEEGEVERDADGDPEFDPTAYNAMMDILLMAFDNKYTQEKLEDFLDLGLVPQILEVFYALSGLKKKMMTIAE